jgi:hypothetical protein
MHIWRAEGPEGQQGLLKIAQSSKGQLSLAREAILLGKVKHPRIPAFITGGDVRKWLVREFVMGQSLRQDRAFPLGEAVEVVAGLAEILAHLHQAGLVHADIKPSNVIIDSEGKPHLLDFGIACVELSRAKPGHFRGTLGHAAPEQLQGEVLRCATDIYALGIVLYLLVTGRLPFEAEDPSALAYLPLATLPEPVASIQPGLPGDLDELIMTMIARDPDRRPESGEKLVRRLRECLGSPPLPILVGMPLARASLRSLVSVAVRGQGGVVVVYGKAGSGRHSLIQEAIRGGRREGLMEGESIEATNKALSATLVEEVVLFEGNDHRPEDVALASRILADRLPCLMFLRSEEPLVVLERRGARHVVPEPLSEEDLLQWLRELGRPVTQAGPLHRRCKGNPGQILSALELHLRGATQLSAIEQEILQRSKIEICSVEELALEFKLGQHAFVDIAERLVDLGLVQVLDHGKRLQALPSPER